ncbi:MAG: cysteine hydrolase family protein [Candidatus Binatia bacterium]
MAQILENLNRRFADGRAAVIIVDAQNDFLHPEGLMAKRGQTPPDQTTLDRFVQNCRELARSARNQGLPVFHAVTSLRADHSDSALAPAWRERGLGPESGFLIEGSWGAQIIAELAPEKGDYVLAKKGHGAFRDTLLDRTLTNLGAIHCFVIGCGGVSGGVDDTARQAAPLGYEVTVVSDATYPVDEYQLSCLDHKADVKSTQEVLSLLQNGNWRVESAEQKDRLGKNFALLVVDLQNDSIHPRGANALYGGSKLTPAEFEMVVRNNQKLMTAMRKKGYSVIHTLPEYRPDEIDFFGSASYYRRRSAEMPPGTKHKQNSWGNEFVEGLEPAEGDIVLVKKTNSAFTFTGLQRLLRNLDVGRCIVTGGSIRGCVNDTIRDGIALGYEMIPVSDATYKPNSPYLRILSDRTQILSTGETLSLLEK